MKKNKSQSAFFNPRALIGALLCLAGVALALFAFRSASAQDNAQSPPVRGEYQGLSPVVHFDVSPPLRDMKPVLLSPGTLRANEDADIVPRIFRPSFEPDPVVQSKLGGMEIPPPIVSFDGQPNSFGGAPPDPNGDVGPNHVVAMANLSFQIWNKTGTSLFGPVANNTLFAGFGGPCQTTNSGDPVVLYDQLADRWLLSQFTAGSAPFFNCVAISTTSDPTGSYFRYAIMTGTTGANFPDYPKYGMMPDAYHISTREFLGSGGPFQGVGAYALNRAQMLAGNPSPQVIFFVVPPGGTPFNIGDGLLPADMDGTTFPPGGSPQYYLGSMDNNGPYGAPQDALTLWKFHVDFAVPANSTFTLTNTINTAPFSSILGLCGGSRACIPQPNTANRIDHLGYRQRPLFRLGYRNFGTHESLVTNQSVSAGTGPSGEVSGIRWWEVRNPNVTPVIFQEGTFAPGLTDGIHRWMGSIAMDGQGNMGLAYSASNSLVFPSVFYTGRLASSPLGTMPLGENHIIVGTGSQTGGGNRWGDYTSLSVDPTDDLTFWHVNQYVPTTSGAGWRLRIGSFLALPGGPSPTPFPTATPLPSPTPSPTPGPTPCGPAVFSENFDAWVPPALPPGWVAANAAGVAPLWVTSATSPDSAPNAVFIDDPATVSDKRLDTPDIAIGSTTATVSFRNNFALEPVGGGTSFFDGGVLEVSSPNIAGGAFTDITAAAVGGNFVTGGYRGTISTVFQNPIGGRMAWSQSSGGYINSVANLGPNVNGQTIKLRFRMASDNSVSATGWRVDTIVVNGGCTGATPTPCPACTPTPTPTPGGTPTPTPTAGPSCSPSVLQGFDDITTLPGLGWVQTNHSTTIGTTGWFQGNDAVFPSQSGAPTSYIGANFNNTTGSDTISNWLLTPPIGLQDGAVLTFWTRTVDAPQFPDRLQVRMSTNGASTNVGTTATDVGDFAALLLDINPTYTLTGYPNVWTLFTVTVTGVPAPTTGRLALRYFVENGGPGGANSDFIGIDTFGFAGICGPTPTPGTPTPSPTPSGTPTPTATPSGTPGPTPTPSGTPTPTPNPGPAQAVNLSSRMLVGTDSNVGIGGFIITGTDPKEVLLRAIGPSTGVPGSLADPLMELHSPGGSTTINNDWRDTQEAEIEATGIAPTNDLESAILITLNPGAYTAIVKGNGTPPGTGVGLVEVYDLDQAAASKLGNIATRAFVSTGNDILIAGFILGNGTSDGFLVIRGIGPSLANFGVPNPLPNPNLSLRDSEGTVIRNSDDWQSDPEQAALLMKLNLAPTSALEAAMVETLPPGSYTALLSDVNNGTGVGLIEVYDNPVAGPTPTPGPTPGPTPTPGGSVTPTPTPVPQQCTESFDGVTAPALPAGWVATNPDPGDGVLWVTTTTSADTAPNAAFIPDQDLVSDKVLISRNITINSAAAQITFRNNFDTEFSDGIFWDGGVLEVSIAGGAFVDVTDPSIGGTFVSGPYTGEISGDASNPLAGRMAWSGSSGGYLNTVINLGASLNGQVIKLRFRMGTDEAVVAPGWWVDGLSITGGSCPP